MGEVTPFPRPVNWSRLRADEAEQIIKQRAQPEKTGNVIFTEHAWDRVDYREITREDAFRILREGYCTDEPARNEKGHWQAIITKRMQGSREAGAVTVIMENSEELFIRTLEWMDLL